MFLRTPGFLLQLINVIRKSFDFETFASSNFKETLSKSIKELWNSLSALDSEKQEQIDKLVRSNELKHAKIDKLENEVEDLKMKVNSLQNCHDETKDIVHQLNDTVEQLNNENETMIDCASNGNGRLVNGRCYLFVSYSSYYENAKQYCIQQGARLYEPRSKSLSKLVYDKSIEVFGGSYEVWVGVNDIFQEGSYVFTSLSLIHISEPTRPY